MTKKLQISGTDLLAQEDPRNSRRIYLHAKRMSQVFLRDSEFQLDLCKADWPTVKKKKGNYLTSNAKNQFFFII